jgi:hypothetical protein
VLVGVPGVWVGIDPITSWIFASIPGIFFIFLVWSTTKGRDIGGINLGEDVLNRFAEIDQQLCYILNELCTGVDKDKMEGSLTNAFSFILGALYDLLSLGSKDNSHLSILHAKDGQLTVISSERVSPAHAAKLGSEFRYGDDPRGLAGHAATRRETIYIPDLENTKDPNTNLWIPLDENEKKIGSIVCLPLIRGLRGSLNEPIGVLNITSTARDAFGSPYKRQLIDRFGYKVEILLYVLEMLESRPT